MDRAAAARLLIRTALGALFVTVPVSARADVSVLVGLTAVGGPRQTVGWAFSHCPSVVGFEIEYFATRRDPAVEPLSGGGISASLVVQPQTTSAVQFFAIGGLGIWADPAGGYGDAKNAGGGVKIRIAGPLKLRLDYRLYLIGHLEDSSSGPTTRVPQRFSVGLHVVF